MSISREKDYNSSYQYKSYGNSLISSLSLSVKSFEEEIDEMILLGH